LEITTSPSFGSNPDTQLSSPDSFPFRNTFSKGALQKKTPASDMSGSVYSTRVQINGTLPSRAAATSLAIAAGAAAEAGFALVSRGLSLFQYALQTSMSRSAGFGPHPIRPAKPERT
jgi:hypothetical protein